MDSVLFYVSLFSKLNLTSSVKLDLRKINDFFEIVTETDAGPSRAGVLFHSVIINH